MSAQVSMPDSEPIAAGATLLPSIRGGTHTPSFLQQLYQCVAVGGLAMASYFFFSNFVLQTVQITGASMAPTLRNAERCILNRWVYYVRAPGRNDLVVLRDPIETGYAVKRIIATPGDTVYLKGGDIFVNGRKLHEPYLPPGTPTYPYLHWNEQLFRCGENEYFVLGDNRLDSADSRTYGPVSRGSLLGVLMH
jgi:signal peptidase I